MDEVDVEVVGPELGEGGVQIGLDELGAVRVVPELGNEEEVFALHAGLLDPIGDLMSVCSNL